ncbi:hypothetical protein EC844_12260 [Acinetobacter calcoaceticus]|uniref:Uncharacterized protein n=1 Tax=Acinetobacter calcoaceticus TaxID=471 RepID=A0A4R1XJQ7_ACICA|nr:hypothetical protein EC844_12260 [Acinetobacter calcoaceticus]
MTQPFKLILFLGLGCLTQLNIAHANVCEDIHFQQSILQQAKLNPDLNQIADCKALPHRPDQIVMVYQQVVKSYDDENGIRDYRLYLLLADRNAKQLISSYKDPDIYPSDAMVLSEVSLDTAAYQLNPQLRAIGLRIDYRGASANSPLDYTLMNLYDLERQRRVLAQLKIETLEGENARSCNAAFKQRNSTLSILPTQHNGMRDIQVNSLETHDKSDQKLTDCVSQVISKTKRTDRLKYNGQYYVIPKNLRMLEE